MTPLYTTHENTDFLAESLKGAIKTYSFPKCLKPADVTAFQKREKRQQGKLYRPVSILPRLSKILERILFEKMSVYFDTFLSDQQCGFRKRYSTQHCLLSLSEKWNNCVDKDKSFEALLTDLSKAFDCLDHELLTAKLNAYGFSLPALRLIHDYL